MTLLEKVFRGKRGRMAGLQACCAYSRTREKKKDKEKAPWKVIQVVNHRDVFPKSYNKTEGGKIRILLLFVIKDHIKSSI